MLWRITLAFKDRDGNIGRCAIHTSAATLAALVSSADMFGSASQGVSSAALVGAVISRNWRYAPATPSAASDVRRKMLLLSRQNAPIVHSSLVVPSANYTVLLPERCGLRYTERAEAPSALRLAVDALLSSGMVNPYGVPVPSEQWVLAGMSDE